MNDLQKLSKIICNELQAQDKSYLETYDVETASFMSGLYFVLEEIYKIQNDNLDNAIT